MRLILWLPNKDWTPNDWRVPLQQASASNENTRHHAEGIDRTQPEAVAQTRAELKLVAYGRHSHVSPVALVTKNPAEIKIRSDQLTYRILLGLLDGTHYIQHPTGLLAEYRQSLPRGRGSVSLALVPREQEAWQQVVDSLDLLGDELVDTFLVLLAVALDIHGTERVTHPFAITPDDILAICQKKKSKGSYPARQRETILAQIHTLARISVRANLILRDGKPWQVESPLFELLPDGLWEANERFARREAMSMIHLKIGDWAGMIPELQSQTVLMARQVLHYHAKQQKNEKRLGRYLTMLYRINVHRNAGRVKVSMGVLLEQAGIPLDRDNPGRTREAIESALNQLQRDGIIGSFAPLIEHSEQGLAVQERIEQHAYHWWDDYRRQLWLFEPSKRLKAHYQNIPD